MIVFDLKCGAGHVFEAWFANSASFDDQRLRNLLICPLCGTPEVDKAVMAPNVGAKGNQRAEAIPAKEAPAQAPAASPSPAEVKVFMETLAKAQAKLLEKSEWVGRDFANVARAMDEGEIDHALVHGQTTPEEAKALIDDGIGVMPLPFPVIPPDKQN